MVVSHPRAAADAARKPRRCPSIARRCQNRRHPLRRSHHALCRHDHRRRLSGRDLQRLYQSIRHLRRAAARRPPAHATLSPYHTGVRFSGGVCADAPERSGNSLRRFLLECENLRPSRLLQHPAYRDSLGVYVSARLPDGTEQFFPERTRSAGPAREGRIALMRLANKAHRKLHQSLAFSRRVEKLTRTLDALMPSAATILDVGCGSGLISWNLQQLSPGRQFTGIDVVERDTCMIPHQIYDGDVLPFAPATFDYVLFVDVLHHSIDAERLLAQAKCIARQGIVLKDHYCESGFDYYTLALMDWFGNAQK